jgi:hypothetical protein
MYRDLVFRPGEDSYSTRDLVFRPGVDKNFAEVLPYTPRDKYTMEVDLLDQARRRAPGYGEGIVAERPSNPGMDEIPRTASLDSFGPDFFNKLENADRAAKAFLDLFMLSKGLVAGLPEPMSQEEFQHEVTKRMDRNKPSVEDVLRNKFGVGSFREGINKGIFPGAPQVRGI